MEEGLISLQDILDTVILECASSISGENIMNYIDFEGYKKTEDKKKRTKELTELLSITKDNDQRQKIFKELREMAENGNK